MTLPLTISIASQEHPSMDYAFLRQEGIRLLEQFGGRWTDFNTHDPGITILEQLCYAITDLGYRINYDIKDLLASGSGDPYRSIHSPAEVLTIDPVTLTDLRKMIIDIPGVKNAWIEPIDKPELPLVYDTSDAGIFLDPTTPLPAQREPLSLRGIYNVWIEKDGEHDFSGIQAEANRRIHARRALGADFHYPRILDTQGIHVTATIEVNVVEDPERLLAKICVALAEAISPHIHFYTLDEMLKKGKHMDEIMNGPVLGHGFIEDEELEHFQRKTSVRTSDLIQEVMNVEGVVAINSISIVTSGSGDKAEKWYLKVPDDQAPSFDLQKSLGTIRLVRGGVEAHPRLDRVQKFINDWQTTSHKEILPDIQRDIQVPKGRDRQVGTYYSIQHQFPAAYGIGALGLSRSATPLRKAQAKQLKAYLMFFDQLLANYFAQLENAKELLSFYSPGSRTYFANIIEDPELGLDCADLDDPNRDCIRANKLEKHTENVETYTEETAIGTRRKDRFLNHLLARFAEQFTDYSLLQFADLHETDLIRDKSAFLQDYKQIGAARGSGFDYTQPAWSQVNISGLEKRLSRKLGIPIPDPAEIMDETRERFYILEHILLRPREADEPQFKDPQSPASWPAGALLTASNHKDPYSHHISVILPNWITRLNQPDYKNFIEKTVLEESPAHLHIQIHWLDNNHMSAFEEARRAWLEAMIAGRFWDPPVIDPENESDRKARVNIRDGRDRMIQVLGWGLPYPLRDLKLFYPSMVAFDQDTKIEIEGAQIGVNYRLCDEDGNPVPGPETGTFFEVQPQAGDANEKVFLPTPKIQRDITFTILAIRKSTDSEASLEVYLNQWVSIQSGIDINLKVAFLPDTSQIATGNTIITNYNTGVKVQVFKSQEGVSYRIVMFDQDGKRVNLSEPQKGNRGTITLISTSTASFTGFTEDTTLNVFAYRTSNWNTNGLLTTELLVKVRPNPAVAVQSQPNIVDYGTGSKIVLVDPQITTGYELYKRELVATEYIASGSGNMIQIHTDEGRDVFIKPPEKITDWNSTNGFKLAGKFVTNNGEVSVTTGSLQEDSLFIVRAIKINNGESLQVDQAFAVLVRPNTAPIVGVGQASVTSGNAGVVTVSGTQKGVSYQLRFASNNTPINLPGYDLTDRGVNTMRLEVDFVVEIRGDAILLLPTKPITKATTFNVLASKILTGVSAELKGRATIDVA